MKLADKIQSIKSELTPEQFELTINSYSQDIAFHKQYGVPTEEQKCNVLNIAMKVALMICPIVQAVDAN